MEDKHIAAECATQILCEVRQELPAGFEAMRLWRSIYDYILAKLNGEDPELPEHE
jgi:hypothetical protein